MALANYVPCVPAKVAQIARLRASWIVSYPSDDSSTSVEEEEVQHPDAQTMDTDPELEDESEDRAGQTDPEDAAE